LNIYTERASPTEFGAIRRPPTKSAATNPTKAAADIQTPGIALLLVMWIK
jgi:hypothetical protein